MSFLHLALLSPDTLNQGVIHNVWSWLSGSVNSPTLVGFSSLPPFFNVSSNRRPFCHPNSNPPQSPKCLHPHSLIIILEKMKSQNSPCNPLQTHPAFFLSPGWLKKAACFLAAFLRLYMQQRLFSQRTVFDTFCVFLGLCVCVRTCRSAVETRKTVWKITSVHLCK